MMRTDADLKNDVRAELVWEPRVTSGNITVDVKDGTVSLNGTVPTYSEKLAAETAALSVMGVNEVKNNLDVELTTAFEREDNEIRDAAERSLIWNAAVPADSIKVSVENGWVTLEGTLENYYQKDAARNTVNTLAGVKGVTDKIEVKSAATPENAKERIKDALKRDAIVDSEKVTVTVEGNRVVLRGSLASWTAKRQAERAALAAPGIYEIENNIRVESERV